MVNEIYHQLPRTNKTLGNITKSNLPQNEKGSLQLQQRSNVLSFMYRARDHSRPSSMIRGNKFAGWVDGPLNILVLRSFHMDQLIKKNWESKPDLAILGADFLSRSHQTKMLS